MDVSREWTYHLSGRPMWKDGALGETLNSLVLGGASVTAIIVRIPSIMTRLGKPLESPARQEGEHGVEKERLTRYITQRVPSDYQEPQLPTTRGDRVPFTLMPSTRGTGHPRGDLPVTAPPGGVARGTATRTPHAIAAGPSFLTPSARARTWIGSLPHAPPCHMHMQWAATAPRQRRHRARPSRGQRRHAGGAPS